MSAPAASDARLLVWVGSASPEAPHHGQVATVLPSAATPMAVMDAVRASKLTPADLKVQALVGFSADVDTAAATAVYAALCVLAGRRLDASCGPRVLSLVALDKALRALSPTPRPDDPPPCVQVGGPHGELPYVVLDGGQLAPADVGLVRHARRVRLVVATELADALTAFVAVAALRARPGAERFPLLVKGDETADLEPLPDGVLPTGLDLDTVRAGAADLRRNQRSERKLSVAPSVPVSDRLRAYAAVVNADMRQVMAALGSTSPDGVLWHCPRPDRHTNGDANASMRVEGSRARCYRCDPEWVNPVRLTADVRKARFEDASTWLGSLGLDQASVAPSTADDDS